jgi:hypothetical protein
MEQATEAPTESKPAKRKQPAWLGKEDAKKPRLEAPWGEIRDLIASGVSMGKVAKQYAQFHPDGWKAMHELIRKRAQRDGYFVPRTQMAIAQEELREKGISVPSMSQNNVPAPSRPENVGTFVAQSLEEMGQEGSLIAGEIGMTLLRDARDNVARIAPIVDVKDLTSAAKLVRLVAGMDRQASPVTLSLWGGPMSPPGTSRDNVRDVSGSVLDEWEA